MSKENGNNKISIIDLLLPYESGPVLRERTPDVNRPFFHPEERIYDDALDSSNKKIKNPIRKNKKLKKEALGLTDIPSGYIPNNPNARQRDKYEQQDFEAQQRTGFGSGSIIDGVEDKHPQNLKRFQGKKTINKATKEEKGSFFNFLETGNLYRKIEKEGGLLSKMDIELAKLALHLDKIGYTKQASEIMSGLKINKSAQSGVNNPYEMEPTPLLAKIIYPYLTKFPNQHAAAKKDPQAEFIRSVSGDGTDEEGLILSIYFSMLMNKPLSTKNIHVIAPNWSSEKEKQYNQLSVEDVVKSELSGWGDAQYLEHALAVLDPNNYVRARVSDVNTSAPNAPAKEAETPSAVQRQPQKQPVKQSSMVMTMISNIQKLIGDEQTGKWSASTDSKLKDFIEANKAKLQDQNIATAIGTDWAANAANAKIVGSNKTYAGNVQGLLDFLTDLSAAQQVAATQPNAAQPTATAPTSNVITMTPEQVIQQLPPALQRKLDRNIVGAIVGPLSRLDPRQFAGQKQKYVKKITKRVPGLSEVEASKLFDAVYNAKLKSMQTKTSNLRKNRLEKLAKKMR